MKLKFIIVSILSFFLLTGFFGGGKQTVKLNTSSGYSTEAWLYKAKESKKEVGVVFLHGKKGNPGNDHNNKFIKNIRKMGYDILAPIMPWSQKQKYDGSREQAMEVIDEAIKAIAKDKVVVIGHSMGGMGVIHYGAGNVPSQVIGLIAVAAGHDPHQSGKIRQITAEHAETACALVAEGKGDKRANYPELNTGKRYEINATAKYYCSFYDTSEFPGLLDVASDIKTPMFILSGNKDRLTHVYSHSEIFDLLPDNANNQYRALPGNHKNVLFKNTQTVADWIDSL